MPQRPLATDKPITKLKFPGMTQCKSCSMSPKIPDSGFNTLTKLVHIWLVITTSKSPSQQVHSVQLCGRVEIIDPL